MTMYMELDWVTLKQGNMVQVDELFTILLQRRMKTIVGRNDATHANCLREAVGLGK